MASGRLGPRGLGLFALADSDPCAAMARRLPLVGVRASVPGAVQVLPGGVGRAPLHGAALGRAQSLAGQLGRTGAKLAMVESRSLHPGRRQGPPTAGPLADPSTEELGLAGQPSRGQEGAGSGLPQRPARTALRQRVMVRTDRPDSGPRIRRTPTGPAP